MSNVVVIPKGFFGDILLSTPIFAALAHAGHRVSVVCTPPTVDLVRRDPNVSEVIIYDRRRGHRGLRGLRSFAQVLRDKKFDIAYSLHRSPRTAIALWLAGVPERVVFSDSSCSILATRRVERPVGTHEVVRNLRLVSAELSVEQRAALNHVSETGEGLPDWTDLSVADVDSQSLSQMASDLIVGGSYVVVAPGSAWATKQWDVAGFRGVAVELMRRGQRVVAIGSEQDRQVCEDVASIAGVINLCGKTSLDDLIGIIRGAACVVCNDSLPLHLCSATKTPVVAIFCATSPKFGFGPWRNRGVTLEKGDLFCKPCHRHGGLRCPTGTRACMLGVKTEDVVCAVEGFLREQGRSIKPALIKPASMAIIESSDGSSAQR